MALYNIFVTSHVCRFCPSVFFYLITIVPCVWILELNMLSYRMAMSACSNRGILPLTDDMQQDVQNVTFFKGVRFLYDGKVP